MFNEENPTSTDLQYLHESSAVSNDCANCTAKRPKAVINAMRGGDPQAIWLMQGWLFLGSFWENSCMVACSWRVIF
jgi:hypothetical protein